MKLRILFLLPVVLSQISSCSEPPPKFTVADEIRLADYRERLAKMKSEMDAGIEEEKRAFAVAKSYSEKLDISLSPVRRDLSNGAGICYDGLISNNGEEVVEKLQLKVELSGGDYYFHTIDAVGEVLLNKKTSEILKPGEVIDASIFYCKLIDNKTLDLSTFTVDIAAIRIRPTFKAAQPLETLSLQSKIMELEEKKDKSEQYY